MHHPRSDRDGARALAPMHAPLVRRCERANLLYQRRLLLFAQEGRREAVGRELHQRIAAQPQLLHTRREVVADVATEIRRVVAVDGDDQAARHEPLHDILAAKVARVHLSTRPTHPENAAVHREAEGVVHCAAGDDAPAGSGWREGRR